MRKFKRSITCFNFVVKKPFSSQ